MMRRGLATLLLVGAACVSPADAQFRRGMFAESTEITLYPIDAPMLLLPAGPIEVDVRNSSSASSRIVERLQDMLARQIGDNDSRLRIVENGGDVVVVATLAEWNETRRSSTKYVSERRQVGTRQVRDKNGNYKTEPVYEYGRNKPSVVINGSAAVRIEVTWKKGGSLADTTARHTIQEEHLTEESPPSRTAVEDLLIDNVVLEAAGRISPGRKPVRVLVARSDEVDKFNSFAQNRRWRDWLAQLTDIKPHRDRKRDAYRVHNLAVAHEALAYEAPATEDAIASMTQAATLIAQAQQQHADEKYIVESATRIARAAGSYRRLTELYANAAAIAKPTPPPPPPAPTPKPTPTAAPAAPAAAVPLGDSGQRLRRRRRPLLLRLLARPRKAGAPLLNR